MAGPWAGRLTIIMNNMKIALAINHRHSINKDQLICDTMEIPLLYIEIPLQCYKIISPYTCIVIS